MDGQRLVEAVIPIAGQCFQHCPPGHGASIVIAAFDVVVWIAFDAVVPFAHGFDQGEPLVDHSFVDAMSRHLVFDPGPDLVVIAGRAVGAPSGWPGNDEQPGIVAVGECALLRIVSLESLTQVVAQDRPQG